MTIKLDKKKVSLLLITAILLLGFYFRTYKLATYYQFDHDQDLYSWTVKDIVVDHHIRLIGQLTSIEGIFIGPLFYYSMVPFFAIFNMNPLAAYIPVTIISLLTIFSFYFVFKKFYGSTTGLIAAFLYACSLGFAFGDRWVVPTQPTPLWSVWFLYLILSLARGELNKLYLAGILIGLIWEVHVAFLPLLILIPIAIFISGKKSKLKQFIPGLIWLLALTIPFWLFEFKHGFLQIHGLINSLKGENDVVVGAARVLKVLQSGSAVILGNMFYRNEWNYLARYVPFLIFSAFLIIKKVIPKKDLILFSVWFLLIYLSQYSSRRPISEYYFGNLIAIVLLIYSLTLAQITDRYKQISLVVVILSLYLLGNLALFYRLPGYTDDGYLQKKDLVDFIKKDSQSKGYPCVGVNYIAREGANVGFKYLFWYRGLKVVDSHSPAPAYTIVIPSDLGKHKLDALFGQYGVIVPGKSDFKDVSVCNDSKWLLIPPYGFTS